MALWKEQTQLLHLLVRQPENVAHHNTRQFGNMNHTGRPASRRLMDPDPKTMINGG